MKEEGEEDEEEMLDEFGRVLKREEMINLIVRPRDSRRSRSRSPSRSRRDYSYRDYQRGTSVYFHGLYLWWDCMCNYGYHPYPLNVLALG
jgi:hypothetical protein